MTIPRVVNRNARLLVQARLPFQGSNLYARMQPQGHYVVFSFGEHWPLFICCDIAGVLTWFVNSERYSTTTSRHASQVHPLAEPMVHLSLEQMRKLAKHGYGVQL